MSGDEALKVIREQEVVPKMMEQNIKRALTAMPVYYATMDCSTCWAEGRYYFRCPYLTVHQRLHFAYQYYLHQIEANPHMIRWL